MSVNADPRIQLEKEKDIEQIDHHEHVHDANRAILSSAIAAEDQEHMSVLKALKLFPKATFWSFMVSFLIIMEAYDNALVNNMMAQPAFQRHFGERLADGTYQVPAAWQSACSYASTIGAFIGILICGQIQPKIGYRWSIILSLVMIVAFIFVSFFAETLPVLFAGQFLIGLPFGFYNCLAQAYASEIAPLPLRGIFTMYNQSCWCTGQLLTAGILYGFRNGNTKWSFKIPFAIQWAWPLPLIAILFFAPESPWWLVRKGRLEEAARSIRRLEGRGITRNTDDMIAMMQRTIEIEDKETEGASYIECFKGVDRVRTLTACVLFASQLWSGLQLGNQATYFYTIAGMGADNAFALGLGTAAIQWVAVVCAFWGVANIGRRTLYLYGVGFQTSLLMVIGILAAASKSSTSFWVQATFLMLIYASYGLTIGPITFTIVAELSSVKLRAKSCALARATYYLFAVPMGYVGSYSLNPTAWDLQGKSAFIWFGTGTCVFIFTYFMVPETKDRSFRELDVLYHRRVSPRLFKSTVVEKDDDE